MPRVPRTFQSPSPAEGAQKRITLTYTELYPCETLGRAPVSRPPLNFPRSLSSSPSSQPKVNNDDQQDGSTTSSDQVDNEGTEAAENANTKNGQEQSQDTNVEISEASSIINDSSPEGKDQPQPSASAGPVELNKYTNSREIEIHERTGADFKETDLQNIQEHVINSKPPPPRVLPKPKPNKPRSHNESLASMQLQPLQQMPLPSDHGSEGLDETSFSNPIYSDELDLHPEHSWTKHLHQKSSIRSRMGNLSAKSSIRSLGDISASISMRSLNRTQGSSSESTLHEVHDHENIPDSFLPTAMDTCNEQHLILIPDSDITESETDNEGFIPEPVLMVEPPNSPTAETMDPVVFIEGAFVPEDDFDQAGTSRRVSITDSEGVFVPEPSPILLSPNSLASNYEQEYAEITDGSQTGYLSVMSSQGTLTTAPSTEGRRNNGRRRGGLVVIALATAALLVVLTIGISLFFSFYHQSNGDEEPNIIISYCPHDIVEYLKEGYTEIVVTWNEPRAEDQVGRDASLLHQTHKSGTYFPAGTTEIIYTFSDHYYLTTKTQECSFYVIVYSHELNPANFLDSSSSSNEDINDSTYGDDEDETYGDDEDYYFK